MEEYIGHWKQIEYEVMQDYDGNNVIVCNMENVLSMKAHTGDNIVVAPSQTIDNHEYHMLRSAALRATKPISIRSSPASISVVSPYTAELSV